MHKNLLFAITIGGAFMICTPMTAQTPTPPIDRTTIMPQNLQRLSKLIGTNVESPTSEKLGDINDFAIDTHTGQVVYALVGYGGVGSVGDKLVAVPINAFTFRQDTRDIDDARRHDTVEKATLSIDEAKFKTTPTINKDQWPTRVNYDYWNVPADPTRPAIGPILKGSQVVGMDLHNEQNEDLGEIQELVVNLPDGRLAYAVLATGGVAGVGEKYHAVPVQVLNFRSEKPGEDVIAYINVDKDRLKNSPSFDKSIWPNMADTSWSTSIHTYYGTKPTDVYVYRLQGRPDPTKSTPPPSNGQGDATSIVSTWPATSKSAAEEMMIKYGSPHSVSRNKIAWENVGPWRSVVVCSEATKHHFPVAHQDCLKTCVNMKVPVDKISEISKFDGSITVDRTAGIVSAHCDKEANNILALNLAYEIATGKKTADQAREALTRAVTNPTSGDTSYMSKLIFASDASNTGDADKSAK